MHTTVMHTSVHAHRRGVDSVLQQVMSFCIVAFPVAPRIFWQLRLQDMHGISMHPAAHHVTSVSSTVMSICHVDLAALAQICSFKVQAVSLH